jgi:selenium-binding protein 1
VRARVQVSFMGDPKGEPRGGFLLFDQALKLKGAWSSERAPFGYDFWYQPRSGVMVSSGWGAPASFSKGFNPADVAAGRYADALYVWDWRARALAQTIHLGADGTVPLETRFLHNPDATVGFVGAALASNVFRFHKQAEGAAAPDTPAAGGGKPAGVGTWAAEVAIRQESVPVSGWALESLPPLITDILISLDDRFLFLSNWLRGDVCQYDISDPYAAPKLVGQLFLGGSIRKGGAVTVTGGPFCGAQPEVQRVHGKELPGGPQMLQLRRAARCTCTHSQCVRCVLAHADPPCRHPFAAWTARGCT